MGTGFPITELSPWADDRSAPFATDCLDRIATLALAVFCIDFSAWRAGCNSDSRFLVSGSPATGFSCTIKLLVIFCDVTFCAG